MTLNSQSRLLEEDVAEARILAAMTSSPVKSHQTTTYINGSLEIITRLCLCTVNEGSGIDGNLSIITI